MVSLWSQVAAAPAALICCGVLAEVAINPVSFGRPHDLGHPGALPAGGGDGSMAPVPQNSVVCHPSAVPAALPPAQVAVLEVSTPTRIAPDRAVYAAFLPLLLLVYDGAWRPPARRSPPGRPWRPPSSPFSPRRGRGLQHLQRPAAGLLLRAAPPCRRAVPRIADEGAGLLLP